MFQKSDRCYEPPISRKVAKTNFFVQLALMTIENKEEKKARAQKKIQDRAIAAATQMLSSYPSGDISQSEQSMTTDQWQTGAGWRGS